MAFVGIRERNRKWLNSQRDNLRSIYYRHAMFGANIDANGDLQINRVIGQNSKGLVINQRDTTNNPVGLEIINAGTGKGLFIDQNGNGISLDIDSEATTVDIINVAATVLTTGIGLDIGDADALTTGGIARLASNSSDTGTRSLLEIINDHASATGVTALKIQQDSTGPCIQLDGGPLLEDQETVTNGSPTLQLFGVTNLDSTGGAITGTLGSPTAGVAAVGLVKVIVMTEASNSSTISITNHQTSDPEVATFDALDEAGVFMWMGTEWVTIFATCTFV